MVREEKTQTGIELKGEGKGRTYQVEKGKDLIGRELSNPSYIDV